MGQRERLVVWGRQVRREPNMSLQLTPEVRPDSDVGASENRLSGFATGDAAGQLNSTLPLPKILWGGGSLPAGAAVMHRR